MSFRIKVVFIVLSLALATGIALSSHLLQHVLSTLGSAVWGP